MIEQAGIQSGDGLVTITFLSPSESVPEPYTLSLFGLGLLLLGIRMRSLS
ncbi:PEP-CTERM sorting domain-containing protein [Candidatus Nitrosacidococcus sp. I8]|nr:PEP-CTERM sorting domain-containing protein [Candidatus Nitrosacidococcus sp. I8]